MGMTGAANGSGAVGLGKEMPVVGALGDDKVEAARDDGDELGESAAGQSGSNGRQGW